MAILLGFAPWIVFWVLVGNVPFAISAVAALAVATAAYVIARVAGSRAGALEIGAVGTFLVLTVLAFTTGESFLTRWMLPLSNAGILLVVLAGVVIGKPVMRELVAAGQPAKTADSESFNRIATLLTWTWLAAFAGMTVSSLIPPVVARDASILDTTKPLSFICYWVIPLVLFSSAAVASRVLSSKLATAAANIAHKTTFVAYSEATIDELYFLAQEHAKREVGPGRDPYDIKVGGLGTPLVGDESRQSWPATYKVRERRS